MIATTKLRVLLVVTAKSKRKPNSNWKSYTLGAAVVVLLSGLAFAVMSPHGIVAGSSTVRVVAAENFWGNIAAQIGGHKVKVTSIISDPNADPHLYESDAHDAIAIATANIVITNGLGYDDFMNKLLSASPNSQRQVLTAANVLGVTGINPNPHLWYNTPKVPEMAAAMESAMAKQDPTDKAEFEKNLATFDASLKPITEAIAQIKLKYGGEPVAYTERVPGYLLGNAGLDVVTPPGFASSIEDGVDPSPSDTAAMDNLMTSHGVKVLLYNAQTVSPVTQHVRDLAVANGIPVIGVTETLPAGEASYQSWQFDQANALQRALSGE